MRQLLLILLTSISSVCFAQDPDFPDYRSKRETFSKVIEKDVRFDLASFTMGGIDESIGKLPLKTLPLTKLEANSISFEGEGIKVQIDLAPFDIKKHKLSYYNNADNDKKYVTRIDSKPYFGNYGEVPDTRIDKIVMLVNGDTVQIPAIAYADIFNPSLASAKDASKSRNNVFISNDGKRVYIYLIKEEAGGGSYEVTWVIQDKKYLRRVVDFGF